ncbi:hypothetical protein KJ951_02100 [Patescibacteria group bacterium]|nr:hypothetical protein [Patescibacteria group bacterium]MBU1703172.1 hypothetical protein [Patescibacteria group bacterium]MBU1954311.1 hypothetical protein [Patescibacteria group bacterium]
MKKLANTPAPDWWKEKPAYKIYYFREYSGILIAIWGLYWLWFIGAIIFSRIILAYFPDIDPVFKYILFIPLKYYFLFNCIGFIGAIIHTITWLGVMPEILPFNLSKKQRHLIFSLLILVWLGLSTLLFILLMNSLL